MLVLVTLNQAHKSVFEKAHRLPDEHSRSMHEQEDATNNESIKWARQIWKRLENSIDRDILGHASKP